MAIKLTDAVVRDLPQPAKGNKVAYDKAVAGFGMRVTAGGSRAFILNYRTRGGRERRYTIGSFPDWKTGAARDEAKEIKKRIDRGGDPLADIESSRQAPTVSALCDRFIAEYLPRKRASTQHTYRLQIESEIRPALGRLKVAEVAFADIDGLHRKLTARGTPYRANRVLALLSIMFTMAGPSKWKMRADNPCKGVERNDEAKRKRYLSTDELTRLAIALDEYGEQQTADIIRMLLLTGARRGEVLQAKWGDFDEALTVWTKPGATTKQKTDHEVPLSEAVQRLLAKLREGAAEGAEWVFPGANGSARRDVKDAWASICRAAKLKNARVHDLRHTFASVLASAGQSLPMIGQLLGHTTPTTTARYAHLFDDPQRAATERAAAIITGKTIAEVLPLPQQRRR